MASDFVHVLAPAMREAAAIARRLEGRVENCPKTGEVTAVKQALTEADTAVQETLLAPLLKHFPEVSLAAEEDTPTVASFPASAAERVVLDPIDGTLHSYLEASGPYSIMIGLAVRGRYEAALVALPREGLFFEAVRGGGAWVSRAGGRRRRARAGAAGNHILVSHGMPEAFVAALRARSFDPIPACGGAVSVAPLVVGAQGGARHASTPGGISIRGRIGVLVAREAGVLVSGAGHRAFPDDTESPAPVLLLASDAAKLAAMEEALGEAGLG
jgi:fructose-1,6-bisphosphatase/inositol monophosphatase family enzyme